MVLETEDCESAIGERSSSQEDLKTMKGVGDKIGHLLLQGVFGKFEGIAVDVHVHRIANRLGWVESRNPTETMVKLGEVFEPQWYGHVNFDLVGLGQLVCNKRKPQCGECVMKDFCGFYEMVKVGEEVLDGE